MMEFKQYRVRYAVNEAAQVTDVAAPTARSAAWLVEFNVTARTSQHVSILEVKVVPNAATR